MAKDSRPPIQLKCTSCKRINYHTQKNVKLQKTALQLKKYCKWERKRTVHKEVK